MRVKMAKFDSDFLKHLFGMYLHRFKDHEKNQAYLREAVPYCEALCAESGTDKWLMGTE